MTRQRKKQQRSAPMDPLHWWLRKQQALRVRLVAEKFNATVITNQQVGGRRMPTYRHPRRPR